MKKNQIYWVLALLFTCISGLKASPTALGEQAKHHWSYDFESAKADKLGDRPNHYDLKLNGLAWSTYAVRRTAGANDFANGNCAARIYGYKMSMKEMPYMAMTEDKQGGIGTIEFVYRAYGEHTTSQVEWCVQVSEDKGEHWQTIGQAFKPTTEVQRFCAKANVKEGRMRIVRADYTIFDYASAGKYDAAFNLDDISITDCEAEVPNRPSIIANNDLLSFGEVNKGEAKKLTLNIVYKNLSADIALSLSGDNAPLFTLSTKNIKVLETNGTADIDVIFVPQALGTQQAVLKLQSGETTTEVHLTGTGIRKAGEFTYSGGEGTKERPYLISTAGDIEDLSVAVDTETDYAGKYFKLTKDIDMTGVSNMKPIGNNFGTSGTTLKAFSGTFDGNKHKISNLNMTFTGKSKIGVALFGILKDAKVMNLTLTNCHFEADAIVASVASVLVSSVLDNCHAGENVTVKARLKPYAGGIVTSVFLSPSTITNCTSSANVVSTDMAVGGILAMNGVHGTIVSRCINYGSVNTNNNYAGGIVGYAESGSLSISDCLNRGDVKAANIAGGIFGMSLQDATVSISSSYNIGKVEATDPNGVFDPIYPTAAKADGVVIKVQNCYYDSNLFQGNSTGMAYAREEMRSEEFTKMLNGDRAEYVWRRLVGVNNEMPVPCGEGQVVTHITQNSAAALSLLKVVDGQLVSSEGARIVAIHDVAGRNYAVSAKLPAGIYLVTFIPSESKTPQTVKVMVALNN